MFLVISLYNNFGLFFCMKSLIKSTEFSGIIEFTITQHIGVHDTNPCVGMRNIEVTYT